MFWYHADVTKLIPVVVSVRPARHISLCNNVVVSVEVPKVVREKLRIQDNPKFCKADISTLPEVNIWCPPIPVEVVQLSK